MRQTCAYMFEVNKKNKKKSRTTKSESGRAKVKSNETKSQKSTKPRKILLQMNNVGYEIEVKDKNHAKNHAKKSRQKQKSQKSKVSKH